MKTFKQFQEQVTPKDELEMSPFSGIKNINMGGVNYIRTKDIINRGIRDFIIKYNVGPFAKNNKVKDKTKIATHDKPLFKSVPATGPRGDQPASDYLRNAATPGGLIKGSITNPLGLKKA